MGRRILGYAVGALALWILVLAVVGPVFGGRIGDRVGQRLADSLVAQVTVERASLALVRGYLELGGLQVRKDDLGHLAIDVAEIRCELPPLGLALVDRRCRDLIVDQVRLEVSSAAVFQLQKPKRRPLSVDHVTINDAELVFSPSAFLPALGEITIKVDHVAAGPTTFKTPLSWMFSMTELRATLDLPAGIVIKLHYKGGVLTAAGGVFGTTPVTLPLAIPVADAADDAKAEIAKLVALGRDLAQQLVTRRAQDWLESKLPF